MHFFLLPQLLMASCPIARSNAMRSPARTAAFARSTLPSRCPPATASTPAFWASSVRWRRAPISAASPRCSVNSSCPARAALTTCASSWPFPRSTCGELIALCCCCRQLRSAVIICCWPSPRTATCSSRRIASVAKRWAHASIGIF